ncbi:MAG: alternative ribosome rescue aminoacyl-tRNA hydrolase ArfB [Cyanobacteriota bacterium]|nr:alternative ribosome rescue aminoacyl-tRNA hydrolase ArfB [Cyanobacteriota bacterium]
MADTLPLTLGSGLELLIPAEELRWRFSRASGPGGQAVNTTDSRVELVFDLLASRALPPPLKARAAARLESRLVEGAVVVVSSEHRGQWRNRQAALRRLRALLEEALRPPPPPRRPTRPSRGAVERRLTTKKQRGLLKGQRRDRPRAEEP